MDDYDDDFMNDPYYFDEEDNDPDDAREAQFDEQIQDGKIYSFDLSQTVTVKRIKDENND